MDGNLKAWDTDRLLSFFEKGGERVEGQGVMGAEMATGVVGEDLADRTCGGGAGEMGGALLRCVFTRHVKSSSSLTPQTLVA
jgi:hypothetical protein